MDNSIAIGFTDKAKIPVYNFWSRSLNTEEENLPTEVSWFDMFSTCATSDRIRLSMAAEEWEKIKEPLFGSHMESLYTTLTRPKTKIQPYFPDNIDSEAIEFCVENNLLNVVMNYYECLLGTFKNIKAVEVRLSKDYEVENIVKVRFIIKIANLDIDDVLADEDNFNRCVLRAIEKDPLSKLVSTIQLI